MPLRTLVRHLRSSTVAIATSIASLSVGARAFVTLVAPATMALSVTFATPAHAEEVKVPFTKTKLPNGLTVILHEDRTVPITVVNVAYDVGSRFEAPKRTGFAHLFEHLMFMGTRRAPTQAFDAWMEAVGGWNNAWTSADRTVYYDVGPPNALPLLLWLEADRMRDLGTFMTKEKLDAQREVVRNERRQTSENRPYGKADLRLPELLYPEDHPYHHPVIGSHEDLEAATVDDVKEFFATWYDPANASLVVAGDFDAKAVAPSIAQMFGSIPTRGKPKDPGAPKYEGKLTTLTSVVRETLVDDVELAKLTVAWQSPKHFAPGDAELDLLASVLAQGKASRLYEALVYKQKIAQSVDATQQSGTLGSQFVIEVLARPGVSLDALEAAVDREIERVRKAPVTAEELTRAKNGYETSFIARLQGVRERASLLNLYEAETGDPGFIGNDLARYRTANAEAIRTTAAKVLDPNARVILRVVPKGADADPRNEKGSDGAPPKAPKGGRS
jgi:predicted Zn-dependent peptidase